MRRIASVGFEYFQPTKSTQWLAFRSENYFGSFGCRPPKLLTNWMKIKNRNIIFSE